MNIRAWFQKAAAKIAAHKGQLLILGAGWSVNRVENLFFDWVAYPYMIGKYGLIMGGGILILISVIWSLAEIWFYDRTKKDWLGIEKVKALRDQAGNSRTARIIGWFMKKGDPIALIGLSIISEPVKVTLYMRKGAYQFNGFGRRDWMLFSFSVLVGNISWALTVSGAIQIVLNYERIWGFIIKLMQIPQYFT